MAKKLIEPTLVDDRLIKRGVKYSDKLFDELAKRLIQIYESCDSYDEWYIKSSAFFDEQGLTPFKEQMNNAIALQVNKHSWTRKKTQELTRMVIQQRVGENIKQTEADIQERVNTIVQEAYKPGYHEVDGKMVPNAPSKQEIAKQIESEVATVNNTRAKAIVRTELQRTAVISDYVINKERGATGWYVECRPDACEYCKECWIEDWSPENDTAPKEVEIENTQGEMEVRAWEGDMVYDINDTAMLPPVHPNCRCTVFYK